MSSVEPPDRPTERLRPDPPPRAVEERRYVEPAPDPYALARLEDALASLRTGLLAIGVVAVAALAVAVYALLRDDERTGDGAPRGASSARVSDLEDRVDRLSRQVQDARSRARAADGLADRVGELEGSVTQLAERPSDGGAGQAIEQLGERVEGIERDVEQLRSAPGTPP